MIYLFSLFLFFVDVCVFLCEVYVQSRGFKTLRSKTRRLQSSSEIPAEAENFTPLFMKVKQSLGVKFVV